METIKEEKKAELEQLLNSLIEKGWDVFPDKKFFWNKDKLRFSKWKKCVWFWNDDYTLRELASKESWLWQFVCENGYNQYRKEYWEWYTKYNMKAEYWDEWDYEYYLIESSLKNEDELENFLLSNINVGW